MNAGRAADGRFGVVAMTVNLLSERSDLYQNRQIDR